MKNLFFLYILACIVLLSGAETAFAQDEITNVVAPLQNTEGRNIGSVFFTQSASKVWVILQVNDLSAGFYGVQIHSNGECDAATSPAFSSAGSVLSSETIADSPGTLPNVFVLEDGTGYMTTTTDRFTVDELLDEDGSSIIIHSNPSNYGKIPPRYGTADAETTASGDVGDGIACGVVQSLASAAALQANLDAIAKLPLDNLPATLSREENAEHGTLILTLSALGGVQITGQIDSAEAGQLGTVSRDGDFALFNFTEITYNVAPIELPGGVRIGPQGIKLDPSQPSTLRVNLNTGEISRDFHWIQTATDVLYDGVPTLALGDTARAQMAEVIDLGDNRYSVRLLTHWRSVINLDTWTVNGITLPSGEIIATAEFDGIYILDFNK